MNNKFENVATEFASDLSTLWKNMEFDGTDLWDMVKNNEIERVMKLKVLRNGILNVGFLNINVVAGGSVVYYPPGTDLKNEFFSKFYMSLSKSEQEEFQRHFGKQITDFFVKMCGKRLL